MRFRPALLLIAPAAAFVPGCLLVVEEPRLSATSLEPGWSVRDWRDGTRASRTVRIADVELEAWAKDPAAAVRLVVRSRAAVGATLEVASVRTDDPARTGDPARRATIGDVRVADASAHYVEGRVPRPLAAGDVVSIPPGGSAYVDLGACVFARYPPETGDVLALDLVIRTAADEERIPVRLEVTSAGRSARVRLTTGH